MKWVVPIPANFVTAAFTVSNAANGYVGGITIDGSIYITHGSTPRSIAYYGMGALLPEPLRVEKPIGGISALEPVSFLDLAISGIHWVQDLDEEALLYLEAGMVDEAYTQVRRGTVQLSATTNSISDAAARGEIDSRSAQQARFYVYKARRLLDRAKGNITKARRKPHDGLLRLARKLIENAENQLELALSVLQD